MRAIVRDSMVTGEAFSFNLEGLSVVDLDTVILQVSNYLKSGGTIVDFYWSGSTLVPSPWG